MRQIQTLLLTSVFALVAGLSSTPAGAQVVTFQQQLIAPTPGTSFGRATDVDGSTAVVGASVEDSQRGAAYVFVKNGSTWQLQQRLTASDAAPTSQFGTDVAVSGNTIVVGARVATLPGGSSQGAAYVFVRNGTTWTEQAKLTASDAASNANFGWAVGIDGNTIVVGSNTTSLQAGRAYVFERTGTTWSETIIPSPSGQSNGLFGSSVDVSGDTVCVGAQGVSGGGAGYIFTRPGGWALQQPLVSNPTAAANSLGAACAVDGDTVLLSAPGYVNGPFFGAVFAFVRSGATWTQQQRLLPADEGRFTEVALNGELAIVGASLQNQSRGAAYVFERSGTTWTRVQKLENLSGQQFDYFGSGPGFDGSTLFLGMPASAGPSRPGQVGIFSVPASQTGAPGAPTNLQANVNGSVLGLTWGAPSSGGAATGYTLVARTSAGAPPVVTLPVGNVSGYTTPAPNGVFVLSIAATNATGTGPESTAVTVTIPSVPVAPGPPTSLAATVAGNAATFNWLAPASGGVVANYILVAGVSPGFTAPLASLPLPGSSNVTTIPGIPPGTYYVRLLAQNAGGTSVASNEVALTVVGPSAPGAPTLNAPMVSGSTVGLSWTPGAGGAPTSYVLTALTSGGAVLANVPLTGSAVSFTGVPSGSYQLRLVAVNSVGASPPSSTVAVVVP